MATLLLGFNLYSSWHWSVKTIANAVMVLFFGIVYHAWPGVLGWPTDRDLPAQFHLYAVNVDEPQSIYLWGGELDRGAEGQVPRSYRLPYTAALHDKVDKASRSLRKGLPVIGLVSSRAAVTESLSLESIRTQDLQIDFVDAPQGLVPDKQ